MTKKENPIKTQDDVTAALKGLKDCADAASNIKELLDAVTRWEGKLMYLIGKRGQIEFPVRHLRFESDSGGQLVLRGAACGTEIRIEGSKQEFQQMAAQVFTLCPFTPVIK